MVEYKKESGIMKLIKEGLSYISQILLAAIVPQISESLDSVIKGIEKKVIQIEERMLRKLSSLIILFVGGIFLVLGFFFFLIEYIELSKTTASFSIGIVILAICLVLNLVGYDK